MGFRQRRTPGGQEHSNGGDTHLGENGVALQILDQCPHLNSSPARAGRLVRMTRYQA